MAIRYIDDSPSPQASKIKYLDEPKSYGPPPADPYLEGLKKIPGYFQKAGDYIAEKGGELQSSPHTPEFLKSPKIPAATGTAVAMIPDVLSMSVGGAGAEDAVGSKLSQALFKSPRAIGQEMRAGLKDAGISRRPPELAGSAKFENPYQYPSSLSNPRGGKFPRPKPELPAEPLPTSTPLKYPDDPASFYNFADSRLKAFASDPKNIKLNPQELNDYKRILSTKITRMEREGLSGDPLYADLSDLKSRVSSLHEAVVPGRAELNKVYGLSKNIRKIPGKIVSAAKTTAKVLGYGGLATGGAYGLYKALE
jgi:hypothetical protein